MKRLIVAILALCLNIFLVDLQVSAQGSFQNRDFESANIPYVPTGQSGGYVAAADGIPGWVAYYGPNQTTQIWHNNYSVGSVNISILGPFWNNFGIYSIIDGSYSVLLQAGSGSGGPANASISQVGTVPANAASIQMMVRANNFSVNFDGNQLVMLPLAATSTYTLYGADISSYAGQSGALTITAIFTPGAVAYPCLFDAIGFSNTAIPEPSVLSLFGLGLLGLGWQWRRGRS